MNVCPMSSNIWFFFFLSFFFSFFVANIDCERTRNLSNASLENGNLLIAPLSRDPAIRFDKKASPTLSILCLISKEKREKKRDVIKRIHRPSNFKQPATHVRPKFAGGKSAAARGKERKRAKTAKRVEE